MSGRAEHRLHAAGLTFKVVVEGQGSPVAILHGFTGSSETMSSVSELLRERFQTIRIDLVGHGASDSPRELAHYAMEACVEQVGSVLDALKRPSTHVIGYSMGGRVAVALGAWKPERVRSLLVVGASAGLQDPQERSDRRRADEALADAIEHDGLETFVDRWMALPLFASQSRLGSGWLERAREQRLRNTPHGLAHSLRGMGTGAQPVLIDRLGEMAVPACWVAGQEDLKFSRLAQELAGRCRFGTAELIPGAGHACHLEDPGTFAEAARKFIERASSHQQT